MSSPRISKIRIALALGALVSVFFAPIWVSIVLMVALSLRFRAIEVLFIGLLIDLLWMTPGTTFFSQLPLFTLGAIILVWALEPLRLEIMK
ncbi:hypothetical protein HY970_04130 [Candidatus Kaiserbacteria bacterium]|nr:hypothetical protein [Candidatus Kaiserbacteria bacterium]